MSRACTLSCWIVLFLATAGNAAEPFAYPEAKHGQGELRYVQSVPVLVLAGSPEEIGEQMGVLALRPAAGGLGLMEQFLKEQGLARFKPLLARLGEGLLARCPSEYRRELDAAARAGGIDRDLLLIGNTFHDIRRAFGCAALMVGPARSTTWSLDLVPTLCKVTGATLSSDRPIDGADFRPLLEGKKVTRQTPLFWHYYRSLGEPRVAMRDGDWVILGHSDAARKEAGATLQAGDTEALKKASLTTFELYNLHDDESQTSDRAKQEPERLGRMRERMVGLYREVIAEGPVWMAPAKSK